MDTSALWKRIAAHHFPDGFARKLAREHGWTDVFTARAIEEYRRFCFLACSAGRMVTPSDAVDEVWHLHLTCSRDYWDVFCADVLRMPFHHEPAGGGRAEALRHREQYARTLFAYEQRFGAPPESIWPSTREQFAPSSFRRVDLKRVRVLPRLSWRGVLAAVGLAAAPAAAIAQEWNPLDWTGPRFLVLYTALLVASILGAILWRRALLAGPVRNAGNLGTYEIAYLTGGAARVVDAGVAELLSTRKAHVDETTGRIVVDAKPRSFAHPLDQVAQTLVDSGSPLLATARVGPGLESTKRSLISRGLLLAPADEARARRLPALLPAAVLAFGAAKMLVGVARGKPVLFLVLLMVVALLATALFATRRAIRTRAGDAALSELRAKHARASRAPTNPELGLAVALMGTSVLATTAWASYHDARKPFTSGDSGGSGCSSGGDGGSGGGDGGGGGCGGCGGGGGGGGD